LSTMLRGKDAFRVEDFGPHLDITAELIRGAQLGRKDRLVFSRIVVLHSSPTVHYRVSLKVCHDGPNGDRFVRVMQGATLTGTLNGVEVCLTDGVLRVQVPVAGLYREHWTNSKNGTAYIVVSFTLPTDFRLGDAGLHDYMASLCVSRWNAQGASLVPGWVLEPRQS
jgi:hypothetical protein